jgi:sulfite reductase alpha subunit-like flavoprotein
MAATSVAPVVAFGSSRGASERAAKAIASSLGVTAVALNSLSLTTLAQAEFAVFVISTIGNGNYPKNAEKFCQGLERAGIDLSRLRFALLALGSTFYTHFCQSGELLHKMLTERGAEPFVGYVRSDKAAADLGVGAIDKFIRGTIAKEKKENAIQFTPIGPESVALPPITFQTVPITDRELLSAPGYSSIPRSVRKSAVQARGVRRPRSARLKVDRPLPHRRIGSADHQSVRIPLCVAANRTSHIFDRFGASRRR